jgi:ribosomal protein S18 acetylase RimI-like enzyme
MNIVIEEDSIEKLPEIHDMIPEFDHGSTLEGFMKIINHREFIFLVAKVDGKVVGFKFGYFQSPTEFFSWLGGVVPEFRRKQIAKKLAEEMEKRVREKGVKFIRMMTLNKFRNMLLFSISNGFKITGKKSGETVDENKIYLSKKLN